MSPVAKMRVTMCSHLFILAAALGVAHLVLPVESLEAPSATHNASLLSTPRADACADNATTNDIASTTDTTSTCPVCPLVPSVPEPRIRSFNSADASGDTVTILESTCIGPPALSDRYASFSDRSFYELVVNCTNVPPSACTIRSSVVLGVGLAPTVGDQPCLTAVNEHMTACCTDDLCDVYPCDINASSNDDDGSSSLWSSPPFFQPNSTTILADSHVNDCTIGPTFHTVSYPTIYAIDGTTLSVAESNIWHRANNMSTHHSSSSSVDIIRGVLECRDEDHAGAYLTVSFVTTAHVEWTDSACALFSLDANTTASCQPNDVVTVLATATALFSVFLLATDQHFPVPICVMLSLAYWSSALWIGWGVSLVVGGTLIVVAITLRRSIVLFPMGGDNCTTPGCDGKFTMPLAAAAGAPDECSKCGCQADNTQQAAKKAKIDYAHADTTPHASPTSGGAFGQASSAETLAESLHDFLIRVGASEGSEQILVNNGFNDVDTLRLATETHLVSIGVNMGTTLKIVKALPGAAPSDAAPSGGSFCFRDCSEPARKAFENYANLGSYLRSGEYTRDGRVIPMQSVVDEICSVDCIPKPFGLVDGPSGIGKTQQVFAVSGHKIIYMPLFTWSGLQPSKQDIYSAFPALREVFMDSVDKDVKLSRVRGKIVQEGDRGVLTSEGLSTLATQAFQTSGLILALLKHFENVSVDDCLEHQTQLSYAFDFAPCVISEVLAYVRGNKDHNVVFVLDEFPSDNSVNNTFARSIFRACGLPVVLMGTDSTMINALAGSTSSREDTTKETWAVAVSESLKCTNESVRLAVDLTHSQMGMFMQYHGYKSLVLQSRPLLAVLFGRAWFRAGVDAHFGGVVRTAAEELFERKYTLRKSPYGLLGQWRSFECGSMAFGPSQPCAGSELIVKHLTLMRIREQEGAEVGDVVQEPVHFVAAKGGIVLKNTKKFLVECYFPTPSMEPLLFLMLQGPPGVHPFVKDDHRITARGALYEISNPPMLAAQKPCHVNSRAVKLDGDELEQLAVVAMVEASHVGGIGGCKLDEFFVALCTTLTAPDKDFRWFDGTVSPPLSTFVRDDVLSLGAQVAWLAPPSPDAPDGNGPYFDMPSDVAMLGVLGQILRPANGEGIDIRILPSGSNWDGVLEMCGEAKNHTIPLKIDTLRKCIDRIPKTTNVHFIFCQTVERSAFSVAKSTRFEVDGVPTDRNVKLLVVKRKALAPASGISSEFELTYLNDNCRMVFESADGVGNGVTEHVTVVIIPLRDIQPGWLTDK